MSPIIPDVRQRAWPVWGRFRTNIDRVCFVLYMATRPQIAQANPHHWLRLHAARVSSEGEALVCCADLRHRGAGLES